MPTLPPRPSERSTLRRRPPGHRHRMLGRDQGVCPVPVALPQQARAALRIAVPDRLIRMTQFGLRHAPDHESGWWLRVQDEMEAFVHAHLPRAASGVSMRLDSERMEVELEYEVPRPSSRLD